MQKVQPYMVSGEIIIIQVEFMLLPDEFFKVSR